MLVELTRLNNPVGVLLLVLYQIPINNKKLRHRGHGRVELNHSSPQNITCIADTTQLCCLLIDFAQQVGTVMMYRVRDEGHDITFYSARDDACMASKETTAGENDRLFVRAGAPKTCLPLGFKVLNCRSLARAGRVVYVLYRVALFTGYVRGHDSKKYKNCRWLRVLHTS